MRSFMDASEYLNISSARYAIMFSLDNLYGLFRPRDFVSDMDNSLFYDLISFDVHHENFVEDVLIDIYLAIRSGKVVININDVIVIKVNGKLFSYRYVKKVSKFMVGTENFMPINNFLEQEINLYMEKIHKNNMVLSVLDGVLFHLNDKAIATKKVCCIEKELFQKGKNVANNTFSLYGLIGYSIKNLNPGGKPFISLKNALYFFDRGFKGGRKSILLSDRRELEMIRDYLQLRCIELDVC